MFLSPWNHFGTGIGGVMPRHTTSPRVDPFIMTLVRSLLLQTYALQCTLSVSLFLSLT